MRATALVIIGSIVAAGMASTSAIRQPASDESLARYVPDDVFLYVMARHNPQREFLEAYWGDVFAALKKSGVAEDAIETVTSLAGLSADQRAEIERIKQHAVDLVSAVDWSQLAGDGMVFAERLEVPDMTAGGQVFMMPTMAWVFRAQAESAGQNYEALVAILDGLVEEVNRLAGGEVLSVQKETRSDTRSASVNFFASLPGAPKLPLSVAKHGDIIVIGLRETLIADVLALLDGTSVQKPLADSRRFNDALTALPPASDSLTFFDMHALLKPMRSFADQLVQLLSGPRDDYRNAGMSEEVTALNHQAMAAYRRGDPAEALALTRKAHELAPDNSLVLYNLACFSTLVGEREQALTFLDQAVEAGFYAPDKIASDPDLKSLHGDPRYEAAVQRATELATGAKAPDVVANSSSTGEAFRLTMQAWQAAEDKDYERALKLAEQAHAAAPTDPRPVYALACFHTLLGHDEKGLELLGQAVKAGYYCPQHIAKDPDLEAIRGKPGYEAALTIARDHAAELSGEKTTDWKRTAERLIDRADNAVGIIDYVASVEYTEGYDVHVESIATLVQDARQRPFYRVLDAPQLTDFDRFLPQETESFSISAGMDLRALYTFLEDSLRLAGPPGDELLAKWAGVQKQVGVDVHADVLDWIGPASVNVTLANGAGSVWMLQVNDEQAAREKIRAGFKFLSEKLPEIISQNRALTGLAMLSIRTAPVGEDLPGFENIYIAMSPQPAVWGVSDGYLMLGSSADAVRLCLATARGEHASIRKNERASSEMLVPNDAFTSVSLTDQRQLGESLAQGIRMVSMMSGMAGMAIPEPEVRTLVSHVSRLLTKLAPVVQEINFYKSTASYTTFDGQTYTTRSVTHYFSPEERPAVPTQPQ